MKTIHRSHNFSIVWNVYHNTTRLPFDFTGKDVEIILFSNSYKEILESYSVTDNVITSNITANTLPCGVYNIVCRYSTLEEQAYISVPNAFQISSRPIFNEIEKQVVLESYASYISPSNILTQFNSLFVRYLGSSTNTRNNIPLELRRTGLIITYINEEGVAITERASSDAQKGNNHWGLDVNWSRIDELSLSGEISVSSNGTWIIDGKETNINAVGPKGDAGLTPWLRTIDNKLHFSYDNVTWEPCSENIAAWFRWNDNKIQISRDNKTWTDLSGKFADNVHIKGYVANYASLPSGAVQGDIYGVGPTYAAEDTEHTNPIYRYYVSNANTWVDNGQFTSIAAGVVQETGHSETEVMSQKAVSTKLSELESLLKNEVKVVDLRDIFKGSTFLNRNEARRRIAVDGIAVKKYDILCYVLDSGEFIKEIMLSDSISQDNIDFMDFEGLYELFVNDKNRPINIDYTSLSDKSSLSHTYDNGILTCHVNNSGTGFVSFNNIDTIKTEYYLLEFQAKSNDENRIIRVGVISSNFNISEEYIDINLTSTYNRYWAILKKSTSFGITIYDEINKLGSFDIKELNIYSSDSELYNIYKNINSTNEKLVDKDITNNYYYNTDNFIESINKKDKYLIKIAFCGDSLIANELGGDIPSDLDEGNTCRPMRLLYNNVPRRFYDKYCYNKPIFRRLDNSDWVKQGFSTFVEEDLFFGTQEVYHKAESSSAYSEITIPKGYEHFALIYRTKSGNGKINITINGERPSTINYENPIISNSVDIPSGVTKEMILSKLNNNSLVNTDLVPLNLVVGNDIIDTNIGETVNGNPYAIYEWNNLEDKDNVIRIYPSDSTRIDVWGCFYWSGNTMVVMNLGHGGHTTTALNHHYRDELFNIEYDAIVFEVPEMNDCARLTKEETISNLSYYFNALSNIEVLWTSCNTWGLSIIHDKNYYTEYTNMQERNDIVRELMKSNNIPFVDIFSIFKNKIEKRGGTLEGGEGGLWYTLDGQHGNSEAVEIWHECLCQVFDKKMLFL